MIFREEFFTYDNALDFGWSLYNDGDDYKIIEKDNKWIVEWFVDID